MRGRIAGSRFAEEEDPGIRELFQDVIRIYYGKQPALVHVIPFMQSSWLDLRNLVALQSVQRQGGRVLYASQFGR